MPFAVSAALRSDYQWYPCNSLLIRQYQEYQIYMNVGCRRLFATEPAIGYDDIIAYQPRKNGER